MNNNSGNWSDLANWNSGRTPVAPVQGPGQVARIGPLTLPTPRLPGAAGGGPTSGQHDTVILERSAANITVTLSSGSHNIRKLYAREALDITGGSLNINYTPSADSTPISAQFSAAVSLSDNASLSVHTLQVDAARTFTVDEGNLSFNKINLMPGATPAKILLNGDVNVTPLAGATAVIANGAGAGASGRVDLGGAARTINVGNGAAVIDLSIDVPIVNGGVTKTGAGTLALSGVNAYGGDTAVEAGTLRLATASLANAADVHLSTGALLDLSFATGTPDEIDSLFIDGVSQPAGVWGAVGSGAAFTSPLITGTGRLQVMTAIPEPAAIALVGVATFTLAAGKRRRR
jgi:autotransporter-associated beta strand protein